MPHLSSTTTAASATTTAMAVTVGETVRRRFRLGCPLALKGGSPGKDYGSVSGTSSITAIWPGSLMIISGAPRYSLMIPLTRILFPL